jgi:PAS domain S-box-containing protein
LLETGKAITSELELEKVVQRVTDIGTELVGAQFGAFFYNVINPNGEIFSLYTISGVPKEAFSKFPMPRNTKIFEPTFSARGTVRYDDVTKQPHYGQNQPYHGMPNGHLPVRSYLAVPVVSVVTKEAIGGLFFGHSEPGIFTEESEKLMEGVAAQAAIAMTNARLFEEKKQTERNLLEQREQYRSIFNATSDSVIIYNNKGYIVEANPAACQIFGYTYNELIQLHASHLFKNVGDFEALKEIALSGRQYSGINTRIKKDGTSFDVEFKGSRFIYKGTPHVMSVVRDVSSKQKVEEALHRSETLANIITSVSPVTLWMTNEKGETIYINQIWHDWVGQPIESQLGMGWFNAIIDEDKPRIQQEFITSFEQRKVYTFDFRIRRRDGEIRWCSSHGSPYFTSEGNFAGYAGSVADITQRKDTEARLASQNVLINTIANNTQQALFLMNDKQVCTYMNPAAEKMTGFTLQEVQGKPLHYYVHHTHPDGRHFPIEECAIDRALPTKHQTQGEEVFIHKNGHFYPVAFTASPIEENGIPIGTVIEARDITEEKALQNALRAKEKEALNMLEEKVKERTYELEKSNYELLQFTSVASHDLKEPVRKISIFSKLLKDKHQDTLDPASSKYLNSIITSSERMGRLIDDLLTFSRLSHIEMEFEPVNLNIIIQKIIEDFEITIFEKEAVIQVEGLPIISGIELQLSQVFQNLISNSLKFSHPERKPNILIYPENNTDRAFHKIIYKDNGIGFPADQSEKIFEVFQRLHSRDKYEGTGVGLAIVQKIISLHRGTIKAIGDEGVGATFELSFPKES